MSGVRCHVSGVTCQVSRVTCQVSRVRCHVSHVRYQVSHAMCIYIYIYIFFFYKMVELVSGGSVINGANVMPMSLIYPVLVALKRHFGLQPQYSHGLF